MSTRDAESVAQRRFVLFLRQYKEQEEWGWQPRLAKATGLHQTSLSNFFGGTRGAGVKTIEKVAEAMGIDSSFFFGARDDDGDYRDFPRRRGSTTERDDVLTPILELRETPIWRRLSEEERTHLESMAAFDGGITTGELYQRAERLILQREAAHKVVADAPAIKTALPEGVKRLPTKKRG